MTSKHRIIIGISIIVVFGVFGMLQLFDKMTPYVSFAEARASDSEVQIIGKLVNGYSEYDEELQGLRFSLIEEGTGDKLDVLYVNNPKPGNFEQATQVVAIGKWNGSYFRSEKLLVKCPSKYQGTDE